MSNFSTTPPIARASATTSATQGITAYTTTPFPRNQLRLATPDFFAESGAAALMNLGIGLGTTKKRLAAKNLDLNFAAGALVANAAIAATALGTVYLLTQFDLCGLDLCHQMSWNNDGPNHLCVKNTTRDTLFQVFRYMIGMNFLHASLVVFGRPVMFRKPKEEFLFSKAVQGLEKLKKRLTDEKAQPDHSDLSEARLHGLRYALLVSRDIAPITATSGGAVPVAVILTDIVLALLEMCRKEEAPKKGKEVAVSTRPPRVPKPWIRESLLAQARAR